MFRDRDGPLAQLREVVFLYRCDRCNVVKADAFGVPAGGQAQCVVCNLVTYHSLLYYDDAHGVFRRVGNKG